VSDEDAAILGGMVLNPSGTTPGGMAGGGGASGRRNGGVTNGGVDSSTPLNRASFELYKNGLMSQMGSPPTADQLYPV
jgi:hypothetical protein